MNNRTMLLILAAAAAYFLLSKPSVAAGAGAGTSPGTSPFPPPPSGPSLLTSGLSYDPLTGGYCYPALYSGTYQGPYPNC